MYSILCVAKVSKHCHGRNNKWPREWGQEGQNHCIVYLTSASIYNYVVLPSPPAMSQGLNIDNAVKFCWVVMSTSFSNDGPDAGENTWLL